MSEIFFHDDGDNISLYRHKRCEKCDTEIRGMILIELESNEDNITLMNILNVEEDTGFPSSSFEHITDGKCI